MIAPTIIIGLGGIGSDICCRVSKLVRDDSQRKRLRFVCIDTDINDLRQRQAEDPRIITIQTSAPYTVGNYLKVNTEAREKWFPVHNILNGKTPTEGAGQVRAISRLAFDTTVREGKMANLEQAIEELYYLDGASDPQAIRVMIVSTLAGGTGSGIVLPTALYIRHFLTTRFRKNASVIRGFFLLPEIMFANKSAEERSSLCCNAYASMRELDAFTRRGDGALEGTMYKDMHLMMPDSTTSAYVDYDVSPFNFCFLYDKRNTDDLQLMSLVDYKEHAANTIYTQTMSGISSRSNSNEDNTIKSLVASNGRNRFCGAGSSLLKYPRDDVLTYIADHWAAENMSEEWLTIDVAFTKEYQEYKERKKRNPTEEEPHRADHYMFAVENPEKGSFADRLHEMVFDTVESGTDVKSISKVDQYVLQLYDYISSQVKNDTEVVKARRKVSNHQYLLKNSLKKSGDMEKDDRIAPEDFADELEKLERECISYARISAQVASRVGRAVATSVFQTEQDFTAASGARQHMEYYMRDADGKFIHPNAARYFIYSLNKIFGDRLVALNSDNSGVSYWEQKALAPFDNVTTPEEETIEDSFKEHKIGKHFFIWYMDKKGREDILNEIEEQIQAIEGHGGKEGYANAIAMRTVYSVGAEFLGKLSEAFEKFYQNLNFYMERTRSEAAEIQRKYVNGEGKATRYVCASTVCLERMLEEMPCQTDGINGKLSAAIFQEMKIYSMIAKQPNASTYFAKLYDETVMGYWRDNVNDVHSEQIDMDVITALEAEAEYETEEGLTDDQKRMYVAQVLDEAERLAAPFIEEPMGEVRHPFNICAYNRAVAGEPDSTRRSFVNKYIDENLSGQVDDNVSPYELMVYRAIYNLSAGDLKRFRAPEGKEEGGIYYRAYLEVYNQLGPNTSTNTVLTPHLDRRWHLTKYLPDLSDANQKILEDRIYTAFAWGMLTGKIQQKKYQSSNDYIVRIRYVPTTRGADTFVVPNGTHCDELYEVVDALEINPPQVLLILKDMQDTMHREKTSRLDLRETKLINCLQWKDKERALGNAGEINPQLIARHDPFCLMQYAESQKASMFDLLYWHKYSTPASEYDERVTFSALNSMVSLLENYVAQYEDDDTVCHERCFEMLRDQFTTFMENLKDDNIKRPAASQRIQDKLASDIAVILDDRIRDTYGLEQHLDGTMSGILADARK